MLTKDIAENKKKQTNTLFTSLAQSWVAGRGPYLKPQVQFFPMQTSWLAYNILKTCVKMSPLSQRVCKFNVTIFSR